MNAIYDFLVGIPLLGSIIQFIWDFIAGLVG